MKNLLHWTFFLFLLLPVIVNAQERHVWIPIKKSAEIKKSSYPHVTAATYPDTVYYSSPDSLKAFTSRFGHGLTTGVFFTIPSKFYPIAIKRLFVNFYGGRTDIGGALNPASIKAMLWINATTPQQINSEHLYTQSFSKTVDVPVDQIRNHVFAFNDSSEISTPVDFAVGIRYTSSPDTINAVSPVFGFPPIKYNDFYVDSTGVDSPRTPVYYDHKTYWSKPDSIGNMSAYLLVNIDTSGTATGITKERWHFPDNPEVITNYPNPFNPTTVITIQSPSNGRASIIIYNLLGNIVYNRNRELQKGEKYSFRWKPENNATGIYFVSLLIKNNRYFHKMIYFK